MTRVNQEVIWNQEHQWGEEEQQEAIVEERWEKKDLSFHALPNFKRKTNIKEEHMCWACLK